MPSLTYTGQDAAPPPLPLEQKAFPKAFVSGAEQKQLCIRNGPTTYTSNSSKKYNRN